MTFLPIAERELRVAARRKFTYWGRLVAAGFVLVVFGLLQGLAAAAHTANSAGQIEFAVLKWMTFIFACCSGVFFTSDSISEEKREGTLGLLFLTDLRGYDVVFGKLLSQSLRAFYGMLAAFPILALPLLTGGVTGGEFALSMLVIANTLFFALAIGLFISTVSRDYTKAMSGTFLVTLIFLLGPLFADSARAAAAGSGFKPFFSVANPAWLLFVSGSHLPTDYWAAFGLQHGLAWVFLLLASFRVPRTWQEKSASPGGSASSFSRRWRYGGPRFRAALRRRWLETGPVHWLALRDRWLPRLVAVLALLVIVFQGYFLAEQFQAYLDGTSSGSYGVFRQMAAVFQRVFGLGLTLWVAAKASQIFIDSVRNGALELLLVTPVTARAIVQAQWNALWRTFLLPALCIVLLQMGARILSVLEMGRTMASNPLGSSDYAFYQIISIALSAVTLLTGLAAVAWFGMWMGLTNRKISVAVFKTVCFVYILPEIAFTFVYAFTVVATSSIGWLSGSRNPFGGLLASAVVGTALNVAKDVFFILWSRKRLLERFRATVAQEGKPGHRPFPPAPPPVPLRRPPGAPPAMTT